MILILSQMDSSLRKTWTTNACLYGRILEIPTVTVKKQTLGGAASFSFAGTNGVSTSFALDTGVNNPATSSLYQLTSMGTATTVTETVNSGWMLTDVSCTDENYVQTGNPQNIPLTISPALPSTGPVTVTIPSVYQKPGAAFILSFTNSKASNRCRRETYLGRCGQFQLRGD